MGGREGRGREEREGERGGKGKGRASGRREGESRRVSLPSPPLPSPSPRSPPSNDDERPRGSILDPRLQGSKVLDRRCVAPRASESSSLGSGLEPRSSIVDPRRTLDPRAAARGPKILGPYLRSSLEECGPEELQSSSLEWRMEPRASTVMHEIFWQARGEGLRRHSLVRPRAAALGALKNSLGRPPADARTASKKK